MQSKHWNVFSETSNQFSPIVQSQFYYVGLTKVLVLDGSMVGRQHAELTIEVWTPIQCLLFQSIVFPCFSHSGNGDTNSDQLVNIHEYTLTTDTQAYNCIDSHRHINCWKILLSGRTVRVLALYVIYLLDEHNEAWYFKGCTNLS